MDYGGQQRLNDVKGQAAAEAGDAQTYSIGEFQTSNDQLITGASQWGSIGVGGVIATKTGGLHGALIYGAGVAGGFAGSWLAQAVHADEYVASFLDNALGMDRIGNGPPHPATIGDFVAHSYAPWGLGAGLLVGVLVGAAVLLTGPLCIGLAIGAAFAGGLAGGFLGSALGGAAAKVGTRTGQIIEGSPDVFIEGRKAAAWTHKAICSKESTPQPIIEGSETIYVNGFPLARIGHKLLCGAVIDTGRRSVLVDNTTQQCAQPASEIPWQMQVFADALGMFAAGKASGILANRLAPRIRATTSSTAKGKSAANTCCRKDPVDVATGEFVEWRTDLHIPGALPIEWRRRYTSNCERRPGFFGPRWLDSWSVFLSRTECDANTIDYHDDEGVVLTFATPDAELHAEHLRAPSLVLRGTRTQPVLWDRERGIAAHFEWRGNSARLSAYSDASGNRCDLIYEGNDNASAQLVRLQHSDGWWLQLHWGSRDVSSVWLHELDRTPVELVRYHHDEHGRIARSASLESGRLYYRYNDDDRLIGWGDDSATHVSVSYDDRGRVSSVDTPNNLHSGRFEYNLDARKTFVWNVGSNEPLDPGACSIFTYNEEHLVTCERDPLGHETHTEWDANHRILAATDALGRTTRSEYDAAGRLLATIDPEGRESRYQYDEDGRLLAAVDPQGRRSSQTFDDCGRLAGDISPDGVETRYDYDRRGRLQTVHLPTGAVRYHYDEQHRPCGRTLPNGAHESWRQDRLGRQDWHTDAMGATTTFDYDEGGRPDQSAAEPPRAGGHLKPARIVRADGGAIAWRYTKEGLLSEETDAEGQTQRWQWGAFDLLTEHLDATGRSTRYRYGMDGRLAELVNAAGQTWQWHYDAAGRLSEEIDYAGRRTRWERDALGRPLLRWQPDGTPWRYQWDERDRLLAIRAPDVRHEYAYDDRDQLIGARVWRGPRLDSRLELEYDEHGRVVAEIHRCGNDAPKHLRWRYDEHGRLAAREGPLGETRYAFDSLGLLREVQTAHGAVHIARDAEGRQTERSSHPLAPAVPQPQACFHLRQTHDKLGRLIHQQAGHATDRRFHWQHDRLTGVDDQRFGNVRWQLDARDQITATDFTGPHQIGDDPARLADGIGRVGQGRDLAGERFGYDAVGNLAAIGGAPLRYDGDVVVQGGHNHYAWDANGRMIRRTEERKGFRPRTWRYEWDGFNRLVAVVTPEDERWRYVYDAFGRRRAKRCETSSPSRPGLRRSEYLWDGPTVAAQWKVYADGTSEAPGEIQEWHYEAGGFTPLAVLQQRNESTRLLHVVADINGAPRELLDNEGGLAWAGQLDTWGRLVRCHVRDRDKAHRQQFFPGYRPAANDPEIDVDLRFENQWADEESGLHYNLNRYYDPAIGQYASQDPLGPAGGMRTHGYVANPTTWVDPLGLAACPVMYSRYKKFREIGMPPAKAYQAAKAARDFAGFSSARQFKGWKSDLLGKGFSPREVADIVHQGSLERGSNLWGENWKRYYEEVSATQYPGDPYHAHHLAEKGSHSTWANENRTILQEVGLNPELSRENLTWAKNKIPGQHGADPQQDLNSGLQNVRGDLDGVKQVLGDWAEISRGR